MHWTWGTCNDETIHWAPGYRVPCYAMLCHAMPCYAYGLNNSPTFDASPWPLGLRIFLRILRIFFRILRIWRWNTTWIHKLTSYLAALPSHKQWWKILQVSLRGLHAAPFRQFQKTSEDTFLTQINKLAWRLIVNSWIHIFCGYLSPYSKMVIISS